MRLVILLSILALSHGFGQRRKRLLLGGQQEIAWDRTNQELIRGTNMAIQKFNAETNTDLYFYKMSEPEPTKVTEQVVQGMMYRVWMQLGATTCLNNEGANVDDCELKTDGARLSCKAEIWSRPWLKDEGLALKIEKLECPPSEDSE